MPKQQNPTTGSPRPRFTAEDIVLAFKSACRENPWTTWIPVKAFLTPYAQTLLEPFRWEVRLPFCTARLKVSPDAVFKFDVEGSIARFCALEVVMENLPTKRDDLLQSSLWKKLLAYRESLWRGVLMKRFASPRVFVLVTVQRNDEARCLADLIKNEFGDGAGLFFVTDIAEIMSAPDALAAKWHHASQGFHTLI